MAGSQPPSPQFLVAQVDVEQPHVFLLGAGASLAAMPTGDRRGRRLPLMNNMVDVLDLGAVLAEHGITDPPANFESLYGELAADPAQAGLLSALEARVYTYFSGLELPDTPTLYDHLVLSLRRKDVIATFNWDPLLPQAYARCRARTRKELPSIFFLHGSVAAAYCPQHSKVVGRPEQKCPECGEVLRPTRLLYPVAKKDYSSNEFIAGEWNAVRAALREAFAFTVFGYSAPTSDVEAKDLLTEAWTDNRLRELVETEIIDIKPDSELEDTWEPFFFSHHYTLRSSFYDSYAGQFSRRSCEALWNQNLEAQWMTPVPIPRSATFLELDRWVTPYVDAEARQP